jgi:hypothetical protein
LEVRHLPQGLDRELQVVLADGQERVRLIQLRLRERQLLLARLRPVKDRSGSLTFHRLAPELNNNPRGTQIKIFSVWGLLPKIKSL